LAIINYQPGRFAWRTRNLRRFVQPVPWKGSRGFFKVPESVVLEALRAAVGAFLV